MVWVYSSHMMMRVIYACDHSHSTTTTTTTTTVCDHTGTLWRRGHRWRYHHHHHRQDLSRQGIGGCRTEHCYRSIREGWKNDGHGEGGGKE